MSLEAYFNYFLIFKYLLKYNYVYNLSELEINYKLILTFGSYILSIIYIIFKINV